mmetsp:Transcript_32320/g.96249  ORF Transcript_32320/g.96249 Transcript_32320/m.96249 type:complete len:111 (+) Transcript_32320:333-665(+)
MDRLSRDSTAHTRSGIRRGSNRTAYCTLHRLHRGAFRTPLDGEEEEEEEEAGEHEVEAAARWGVAAPAVAKLVGATSARVRLVVVASEGAALSVAAATAGRTAVALKEEE